MKTTRAAPALLSLTLVLSLGLSSSVYASPAPPGASQTVTKRAPSGPPLSSIAPQAEDEGTAGVPSGSGDPLVENGLASPLCKSSMSGGLSTAAQGNCQTSGFVGASAPTGNYAIDVNIDVGPFGLSKGGLLSVIQDVFVTPLWNALVWVVHALVVMLEWCYTLELLGGSTMSSIARSLREAQTSFTEPWLALVLAVASVLAIYNGLVRRRVTETLGQALITIAMMAIGLWVIADPLGTVGVVGRWADQASLGTLGAVAQGTPADAPRTLADSMRALFTGAIEMPWCYLEFGNVRWCSEPSLLDSSLHKAALSIAAGRQAKLSCKPGLDRPMCASGIDTSALTVAHTNELLREADTNGKLFLAFPANRSERNSVKEEESLLRVLCQSEDDTKCTGPTAAQAEFRSDSGTFPRMIGVLLIAIGVLGMVMLFGLIALHLLAAAVVSLFMLLLAPFAVLAPALGDGGRFVFGSWLTRLLGAVTSKLFFSFLLGALLTMQRILMSLQSLGWWTEWLLISAFWWTVFLKRHQTQALLQSRARGSAVRERRPIGRRIGGPLHAQQVVRGPARWAKRKALQPASVTEQLRRRNREDRGGKSKSCHEHKVPGPGHRPGRISLAPTQERPHAPASLLAKRAQLERVRGAHEMALATGDRRRAAKLVVRERRIDAELAQEQRSQENARPHMVLGEGVLQRGDRRRMRHTPLAVDGKDAVDASSRSPGRDREAQYAPKSDWPVGQQARADEKTFFRQPSGSSLSGGPARDPQGVREQRSRVMDDAHAVAEGRKRQLGFEPPQ